MQTWFPTDYPPNWRNSDFTGATVCLGEPMAVRWCLGDLRRTAEEFHVDMLEHDQVMLVEQCGRRGHGHTASPIDVAYHSAQGYYQVQDGLRSRFPNLLLEDCCNGGNLVDYGILRRTHYVSITDVYDPVSNRRAFFDSSYAMPPGDVRVLRGEPAGQDAGQFPLHAAERADGVVHDHDRHGAGRPPSRRRRNANSPSISRRCGR